MITGQQCLAVIILFLFIGICVGMTIWYLIGYPKCNHEYGKIIDDIETNIDGRATGHVVVHMCKKCGKRKVTKV